MFSASILPKNIDIIWIDDLVFTVIKFTFMGTKILSSAIFDMFTGIKFCGYVMFPT